MNIQAIRSRPIRIIAMASLAIACSSPQTNETTQSTAEALSTCASQTVAVIDLHGDFADIWAGRETSDTGKKADPTTPVVVDFNTTVQGSRVTAQFVPQKTDGSCGSNVAATLSSSLVPSVLWGSTASDASRPAVPGPYNLIAQTTISGVVNAAGPLAAGGDVTLTSFSVNSTAHQTAGIVAGGHATLANGSVFGNVSYGLTSTIPQTVTVSGTKSQQSFSVASAFSSLQVLSTLLSEESTTGTVTATSGNLTLTGTHAGVNVFQLTSDSLAQATTVQITVPAGAGALINVSGGSIAIQSKNVVLSGGTSAGVLWNLPGASFVVISSLSLPGSILAPNAALSFDSGTLAGTIVAQSFTSSGSGSIQYAPLNVALLLSASSPSSVALTPATPLLRGCTYEFVLPASVPLTSSNACLATALNVTFQVAAHPSTPSERELSNTTSDPTLHTARMFSARSGINTPIADVWTRYQSVTGISPGDLVLTNSRPSSTVSGQTLGTYQQYHQGYPVFGYGYQVATSNGIFRSANGKAAPNLPTPPAAPIAAATATQAATQFLKLTTPPWVAKPSLYHAPLATLGFMAKRPQASVLADFSFVWDVRLAGSGVHGAGGLQVDASSAKVTSSDPGTAQVTFLDPNATYQNQDPSGTVQTPNDGTQPLNLALYTQPSGALVSTLMTGNRATPAGLLSSVEQTTDVLEGGNTTTVQPVVNPLLNWTATTGAIEQNMATAYWGLVRANSFMQSLQLQPTGSSPWTSIDGIGHKQVMLGWEGQFALAETGYQSTISTNDIAYITMIAPVDRSTTPHEYGHALLSNVRRALLVTPDLVLRGESGGVGEGLADLFSISTIHRTSPTVTDWQCMLDNNACTGLDGDARDLSNPARTQLPNYYLGPFYRTYTDVTHCPDSDFCFVHANSTVIGYWGYLLGLGSNAAAEANQCGLNVDPLSSDPDTSLRMLLNINYLAAGDHLGFAGQLAEPTFADFRDATIAVARDLATQGVYPSDTPSKVELAWYAVGLGPQFQEASTSVSPPSDAVTPADDSVSIDPWQTFSWPINGDGQSAQAWDFQITDSSFDTNLLEEKDNITTTVDSGTATMGTLSLALPFDSTSRYFWRVRPHASGAWLGCYPVHSFVATSEPGSIENIAPGFPPLSPGVNTIVWDAVNGAASYNVFVSTRDSNCVAAGDVIQTSALAGGTSATQGIATISGLQPSTHYFIEVQPVGPDDFSGQPSVGGCFKAGFDARALMPPVPGTPLDTQIFDYHGSNHPTFGWLAFDQPDHYLLQLFERVDLAGTCATTPITVTVPETCSSWLSDTCNEPTAFDGQPVTPINPLGYCWNVIAVAKNGERSPASTTRSFVYGIGSLTKSSPGRFPPNLAFDQPNPLPAPVGTSLYGQDVQFQWTPESDAFDYQIKVGQWPFAEIVAGEPNVPFSPADPPNCFDLDATSGQATLNQPPSILCDFSGDCIDVGATSQGALPEFGCNEAPVNGTFLRASTTASSITLPSASVGQGRYCWYVWPEVVDPKQPGVRDQRQPYVPLFPQFCYTTGPAPPMIMLDNPPDATKFSSAPITGTVIFPYVPDGQASIHTSAPDDFTFSLAGCPEEPNAVLYDDHYNCKITFSLNPEPSTTYTITANTWNSDQHPPIEDDTTVGPHATKDFTTAACGDSGEACCKGNLCNTDDLACSSDGTCVPCGTNNGPCCDNGGCNGTNYFCTSGTCILCGDTPGSHCCPHTAEDLDPGDTCQGFLECKNETCVPCGDKGQDCCDGGCFGPQQGDLNCVSNTCMDCGHVGQKCCPPGLANRPQGCVARSFCAGSGGTCVACGGPGQSCCIKPDADCNDGSQCSSAGGICPGASSGGGGPCQATLAFSGQPSYAATFSPGAQLSVQVCNAGSTAATAFVEANVSASLVEDQSDTCTFWGTQQRGDPDDTRSGGCGSTMDTRSIFAPSIAPNSCATYFFDTFVDVSGDYDWTFSVNGCSAGMVSTIYECDDLSQAAFICDRMQ